MEDRRGGHRQVNVRFSEEEIELMAIIGCLDGESATANVLRAALLKWGISRLEGHLEESRHDSEISRGVHLIGRILGLAMKFDPASRNITWKLDTGGQGGAEEAEAWRPLAQLSTYEGEVFYPYNPLEIEKRMKGVSYGWRASLQHESYPHPFLSMPEVQELTDVKQLYGTVRWKKRDERGIPGAAYIVTRTGTDDDQQNDNPDWFDRGYFYLRKLGMPTAQATILQLNMLHDFDLWLFRRVKYRNSAKDTVRFENFGKVKVEAFDPELDAWRIRLGSSMPPSYTAGHLSFQYLIPNSSPHKT